MAQCLLTRAPQERRDERCPRGPNVKVLLLSEDIGTRDLLQDGFREYGHEVVLGEHTIAPWRLIRGDVDILLYDLGTASVERWEKLSQWRRIADLPLITMGLAAQEEHAVRALHL
jgi:DNA-binding response OmpR family regulator